jgi:hypothetical protein
MGLSMGRNNRQALRFFFVIVIIMAFVGAWIADSTWQTLTRDLNVEVSTQTDWISLAAAALEDGIQFFQGATADTQ